MKKKKVLVGILVTVMILGITFFVIDYNRVKKQQKPIFCIKNPAGVYQDGGTVEYFGLGYKVIDFNRLGGYDEIKIGTWFMDYNDFSDEYETEPGLIPVENTTNSYTPNNINVTNHYENINRSPDNVSIEIDNQSISNTNVSIIITDNNKTPYGWGVEFKVQKKSDLEWENLKFIFNDLSWIDIAYKLNDDNKITEKLDIEKYYGKLDKGIYRIVKPVYDNKYIDIYSNEFEIK